MPLVKMPDGQVVDMPDVLSAEQRTALEAKVAEKPSAWREAWDSAKSFGADLARGAGRGLAEMAEGAAAFNSTERPSFNKTPEGQTVVGPSGDTPLVLTDAVNRALPVPPGASTARSYVRAGLEGLGGGVASGGGVNPVAMVSAVGSGLGTEAGQRIGGAPGAFVGGLAGGLAAGGAAALAGRTRPQTTSVAREALEGFTEAEFRAAQAFKNKHTDAGTEIDLAQALAAVTGREGNLAQIRNVLANRSAGNEVQRVLNNQPAAVQREGQITLAGLPGRDQITTTQAANNLQETATQAIEAAKRQRSQDWGNTVKQGMAALGDDVVPPQVLSQVDNFLAKTIASHPPGSVEAAELSGLRQALAGRDGKMLTDPMQINQIFGQFTTRLKSPDLKTLGVDAGKNKYLGGVVGELRKQLGDSFEPIRQANTGFRTFTESTINPLKQGPVGTLAQPRGYAPDTQAAISKFDGLLHTGTPAGVKTSDLRTAVKELGKVDPTAVEDSFKNWVSRQMGKAMDTPTAAGEPSTNADMAKRLHDGLFKDSARWQGIKDVAAEMAILRGQKPEEVIRGLENYRQLINAARSRPRSMEGLSADDLKQLGGSSGFANAVRVFSFLPANRLGEAIERSVLGKTFSEFDTILTSREGADRLIKLGKVPVMSAGAQIMFGTLGAGLGNPSGLSQNNPPDK